MALFVKGGTIMCRRKKRYKKIYLSEIGKIRYDFDMSKEKNYLWVFSIL